MPRTTTPRFIPTQSDHDSLRPNAAEAEYLIGLEIDSQKLDSYCKYTDVIAVTNELDALHELKRYIKPGADVLTISGSGDHVLFPYIYGAKRVVGADISYNSYLVTAIKIIATQVCKNNIEYNTFLRDFYNHRKTEKQVEIFTKIATCMMLFDEEMAHYFLDMTTKHKIDLFPSLATCDLYTLSQDEFLKLKNKFRTLLPVQFGKKYTISQIDQSAMTCARDTFRKQVPFHWTDIANLSAKLGDTTYDLINYSNVFDFVSTGVQRRVLNDTQKHMKPNGCLFFTTSMPNTQMNMCLEVFDASKYDIKQKQYIKTNPYKEYWRILVQNYTR